MSINSEEVQEALESFDANPTTFNLKCPTHNALEAFTLSKSPEGKWQLERSEEGDSSKGKSSALGAPITVEEVRTKFEALCRCWLETYENDRSKATQSSCPIAALGSLAGSTLSGELVTLAKEPELDKRCERLGEALGLELGDNDTDDDSTDEA